MGRDGRSFRAGDASKLITASLRQAPGKALPIDYDHQIDLAPKVGAQAPASGWIKSLQARADGIWGRVEWTPLARARIASREYRFISPVFLHSPAGEVSVLLRAALTNNPNLTQLASLNSAGQRMDNEQLLGALRELLSLPETADAGAVLEAARNSFTAMNTPDPTRFVPIEVFQRAVAEANKANLGLSLNEAERVVDDAIRDRRVMPWMREWSVALCTANAPAFKQFLEGVGPALNTLFSTLSAPADFSRQRAADAGVNPNLSPIAANLGLTAEDMAKYGR
ncbi:phage protease [Sediminicoccus sp. KRV36]|uniref:phage protease n=1 Tax=Sediminicoccus sp. KRV36 TaxID=3133721 RepID=UPI00200F7E7F|nr:phage protease [Sediminicoccus rosea]